MKLLALIALALITGCSTARSCSIGVSLLPPGPIVTCTLDTSPKGQEPDDV
jgi:hypothetical protein